MKPTEPAPIICGTDFSDNAAQAATAAAVLAARSGRPLLLVHAADEFGGYANDQKELAAHLRPLAKRLRGEKYRLEKMGAAVRVKLLVGSPAEDAINDLEEKRGAALVVVSSVSKTAFDRWTLGSVSERLAQAGPVPTLVVRDAAPFEAWARGERALKVFVAADFSSVSGAALQWVHDLRGLGPCDVVVAHVDRPEHEVERLGDFSTILKNPPAVQSVRERDLRKRVRAPLGREGVRIVVEPALERPDVRLIELARQEQADVFVVGTHQRHGLARLGHASISRGILRHAPMSVACVPAAAFGKESPGVPEIRRVLVATDLSELGDRAVPHAYALAGEGGVVLLLHVTDPIPLTIDLASKVDKALEKHTARVREAWARVRALIPDGGKTRGITSEARVTEDKNPARAICQAAERFDADVICLGSHGRSGVSAALLGSVAQAVMAQTRRPVLVVRPPAA